MSKCRLACKWTGGTRVRWVGVTMMLLFASLQAPQAGGQEPDMDAGGRKHVHIVANANVKIQALSVREVADIFLGRKRQWADGSRIKLAVLKRAEIQDKFLDTCVGKSPSQYWIYWRNIVFSGSGRMPKIFASEKELLAYVATEDGAVGHIANINLTQSIDVVIISMGEKKDK